MEELVPERSEFACGEQDGPGCSFENPSQRILDRMAECGVVPMELPMALLRPAVVDFPSAIYDDLELSEPELESIQVVARELGDELESLMIAADAASGQNRLDGTGRLGFVQALGAHHDDAIRGARQQVARTRAWDRDVAHETPAPEYVRLYQALSTARQKYESRLGEVLGKTRARLLVRSSMKHRYLHGRCPQ